MAVVVGVVVVALEIRGQALSAAGREDVRAVRSLVESDLLDAQVRVSALEVLLERINDNHNVMREKVATMAAELREMRGTSEGADE